MTQSRLRILLVEDDPIHAMVMKQVLDDSQRLEDLTHVSDGDEAVEFVCRRGRHAHRPAQHDPDLILLDIRLPTLDGFDVLKTIRDNDATRQVPVVMVSTSDDPEEVRRSYRLGANAYVCKSADFTVFSDRLTRVERFWSEVVELPRR
jgi:two-component system response regulator